MAEEPSKEEVEKKRAEEEQKKLDQEQLDNAKKEEEKPIDKIDKANEAAERLERANKKHEELVLRQEKLAIESKLGGESEITDKPTQEDKDKEAARKLLPDGMECPGVTD